MQPSSPNTLRILYWFIQSFSRFTGSRNIWEKTKHFWRSRRTRKCFSTITTKSMTIQTDESSMPQNIEVCTKKWTQIRTKTRDALHPHLGNLEVWMPPFGHKNLGEIRLYLGRSTVAIPKKATAIYHYTINYQLINMLSATLHQHLRRQSIYGQINLMT